MMRYFKTATKLYFGIILQVIKKFIDGIKTFISTCNRIPFSCYSNLQTFLKVVTLVLAQRSLIATNLLVN